MRVGIDEARNLLPRCFIVSGGAGTQGMDAAVYVGVVHGVVVVECLQHMLWLLGGGCVVQVHQGAPIHFLVQDGEVLAAACAKLLLLGEGCLR